MKKFRCYFLCILSLLLFSPQILSASDSKVDIFIGVLAKRSPEQCLQQWQPLAEYLNKNVNDSNFIIVPLGFKKIDNAVEEKNVDFVLSNPAIYVNLEKKFRVTRIVTMENILLGTHSSQFGGVLFTKSNRLDIRTLANLKGKNFMAVSPTSFGGWLTSWRYLEKENINPQSHFKNLDFGYSHDAVVRAVQEGKVDAGAIRSGILELMALEGKIDLEDFYVIDDKRDSTNSAFMHTTRLYPEWAFAMLINTDRKLAEKVTVALLKMQPGTFFPYNIANATWTIPLDYQSVHQCLKELQISPYENFGRITWKNMIDQQLPLLIGLTAVLISGWLITVYFLALNQRLKTTISDRIEAEREKDRMQTRLLHAQKLESVGQLAAGIAHEINTPAQFIGTNIDFMDEATGDITAFMEHIQQIAENASQDTGDKIRAALDEADWEYLAEELPQAIGQSQEGIKRVTSIVQAMKEFSHPSSREKVPESLNHIVETTVTVARNEWRYVAELVLELDPDLPHVPLLVDEIGQVILNVLVNGAHAISTKLKDNPEKKMGEITITTRPVTGGVEMRIRDNGTGISEEIKDHIFDPFYTTKEVGKGTGQGLAISHDVIVKKHHGTIAVETTPGKDTTFIIQLPLEEEKSDE